MQARPSGVQRKGQTFGVRLRAIFYYLRITLGTLVQVSLGRLVRGPRHPSWDFRYELAATLIRNLSNQVHSVPLPELRKLALPTRIPRALQALVQHREGSFSGLHAEFFTPQGYKPGDRTMLYLHGGGYIMCSPATHRDLVARLAAASGARCIAVDYRKAPEYPFPAGIEDCEGAYRALLDELPADRIILAGDSAGAGLALTVMLRARDAGLPLPDSAVLISPWCDLSCRGESVQKNSAYDYLSPAGLEFGISHYLQGQDRQHPHVSHVFADLHGLPPLLVITGDAELFYSENVELVERAREHGVEVVHHVEPGRVHVSALLASLAPVSASSFELIAAFTQGRLHAAHAPASASEHAARQDLRAV